VPLKENDVKKVIAAESLVDNNKQHDKSSKAQLDRKNKESAKNVVPQVKNPEKTKEAKGVPEMKKAREEVVEEEKRKKKSEKNTQETLPVKTKRPEQSLPPTKLKDFNLDEMDVDDDDEDFESFDESDVPIMEDDDDDDDDDDVPMDVDDSNDDGDDDQEEEEEEEDDKESFVVPSRRLKLKGISNDGAQKLLLMSLSAKHQKPPTPSKTPASQIFARSKTTAEEEDSMDDSLDHVSKTPQPKSVTNKPDGEALRQTQSAPTSPGQKRVKINLKQNKSIDLDSIVMKGRSPHRPDAKPSSGILRSAQKKPLAAATSASSSTVATHVSSSAAVDSRAGNAKALTKGKKRPSADDYF
jgi:hypothetical protein